MKLYCLFDTVAEEAGPLFESRNDALARRIYEQFELPTGSSRSDFKLMKLGSYFRGNETEKPAVYALAKPYDITNVAIRNLETEEEKQDEAV